MWRFLIVEEPSGRYTWRLIGANGRVVAVAGQSWETPGEARQAAESVRGNAQWAEVQLGLTGGQRPIRARPRRRARRR